MLTLKLSNNPLGLFKTVPLAKKGMVDRVLSEHLPLSGEDVAASGESAAMFLGRDRAPAERLRDAALLMYFSGFMSIGGPIFLTIGLLPALQNTWTTSQITVVVLLVLAALSVTIGVIVSAGALKMRNAKNYRFCRLSAIVAMLPLSFGFVLGLPFGIWALLVLRRPDVKAAFDRNDVQP